MRRKTHRYKGNINEKEKSICQRQIRMNENLNDDDDDDDDDYYSFILFSNSHNIIFLSFFDIFFVLKIVTVCTYLNPLFQRFVICANPIPQVCA